MNLAQLIRSRDQAIIAKQNAPEHEVEYYDGLIRRLQDQIDAARRLPRAPYRCRSSTRTRSFF